MAVALHPSVRHFSQDMMCRYGAKLVRINPRDYEVRGEDAVGIEAGAREGLEAIDGLMS